MEALIASNNRARHDYHIDDRYEAGLVLTGTEVKSLRQRKASLLDSYAHFRKGELFLAKMHIPEYECGNRFNHEPLRERKLLLHKRELAKLQVRTAERGYTLIPLRLYFKNGRVKVEIGVGKGKREYDKRESIKEREVKRDLARATKQWR